MFRRLQNGKPQYRQVPPFLKSTISFFWVICDSPTLSSEYCSFPGSLTGGRGTKENTGERGKMTTTYSGTGDSADDLYKVSKDLVDMIINDAMTEIGVEGGEKEADGADENEIKAPDEEGAEEFGEMTGEDKTEEDAPQLEEEPSQLEEQPPQLEEKPSQLEEARETGEEDQETAGEETGGEGDVQEEEEKEVEKQEEKKEVDNG